MTNEQFFEIVGDRMFQARADLRNGRRLVHYTSAEAAYKILTGAQVWMRSAAVMNDFSEVRHGLDCLYAAWASPPGLALQEMLDRLRQGLRNELATLFEGHAVNLQTDTYITSLSEHETTEDQLGRLSMWRAYGGKAGVALVLNSTAFAAQTDAMKAYSAPIFYADQSKFTEWFQGWASRLLVHEPSLRSMDPQLIRNVLFQTFRIFAMSTKHPGFEEEREWRVFHSPVHEGASPWVEYGIEVVRGLPQPLVKLKLFDDAEAGIAGVAPRSLINRVIIGPCDYPLQVRNAIHEAMERADIDDIDNKLWMSLIPLRQS